MSGSSYMATGLLSTINFTILFSVKYIPWETPFLKNAISLVAFIFSSLDIVNTIPNSMLTIKWLIDQRADQCIWLCACLT